MDVVRALFRAVNRRDLDTIAALYHPECVAEYVFSAREVREGRAAIRDGWAAAFADGAGGLGGGDRFDVSQIGGLETGWGWARAEWVSLIVEAASGEPRASAGYSHFWVEDGLIRRHRSIAHPLAPEALRTPRAESARRYPTRPLVGVGGVIFAADGRVVLVRRRHEPLAGQWSLPGGMLELGETLEAGVAREMAEETGLRVDVGPVVEVFDRILLDETGRVRYHFVLIDYYCRIIAGTPVAGSDVDAVQLADPRDLAPFRLTDKAQGVIARAVDFHRPNAAVR